MKSEVKKVEWEEIVPPTITKPPGDGECPVCGGAIRQGQIPCPDGRPGCCVFHVGFRCDDCRRQFQRKPPDAP